MLEREKTVDTPSADHDAMALYWRTVADILGGIETMRRGGSRHLPRFPEESDADYKFRLSQTKLTNIFGDILDTLAAKPFTKEVALVDGSASPKIAALAEDIDGQGTNLHRFAASLFHDGLRDAIVWLFVDYTSNVPQDATVATEKALGARPYFVRLAADNMLDVRTASIDGEEQFILARWRERSVVKDGEWGEKMVERVRVVKREAIDAEGEATRYAPATWELWERVETPNRYPGNEWQIVDAGEISLGVIPLVPFVTGRRVGGSWRIEPPLRAAAELQIELYQQESGLKFLKEMCCYPMLSGNGVTPDKDAAGNAAPIRVGPKSVLYSPMDSNGRYGEWKFIEPQATTMRVLMDDIKETQQQLRELGRQPLTAQSGNLTTVTTAFAATKANSVISAWALELKDVLEAGFVYVAAWIKDPSEAEIFVNTDIASGIPDDRGIDALLEARKNGDLSRATLLEEMKRRDMLGPEFTLEREDERLLDEAPGEPDDDEYSATNVTPLRPASNQ
ncbi:hypothetical protein Ms3S1_05030 [Methylosinus sp. 3S-1]|uniref:DUF4055 domain-containing protein n=2 Tax=Methylosinus TaxID=425 RepID=A0A2D2CVW1_METT3|nr:DUF4055 domain-containing protein [Methylosinus trichosporium OB3b]